jgi:molybdenum cofactor biosynthesis protein B
MASAHEIRVATVTVSDTRTDADDEGGRRLRELLAEAGFTLAGHVIVRDDPDEVRGAIERSAEDGVDVVVTTGGTGIAPRDQTFEAVSGMLDKKLDGFGEAFRRLSWDQIGPHSILSRAVAGTWRGRIVVSLPGSPKALDVAIPKLLAPVLAHAVMLASGRGSHARPNDPTSRTSGS